MKKYELEEGQKVIIRPRLSVGRIYGGLTFTEEMKRFRNKEVVIKNIDGVGDFHIEGLDDFMFSQDMIIPESVRKKEQLKDGDRIRVTNDCPYKQLVGLTGVCRESNGDSWIEFDEKRGMFHDASGRGRDGHCYYISFNERGIIKDVEKPVEITTPKEDNEKLDKLIESVDKLVKVNQSSRLEEAMIEGIISKGKDLATEDLKKEIKEDLDKFIQETYGILPKKIVIEKDFKTKEIDGIFHKDFEKICKIVSRNIPLMLVGGAGAGKNYTLEQVAEALDLDFYTTNAVNQEYKLTGFIDANGKYHETEFYKAFTNGGMFFLDEIDASCPEALIILNGAIANKYFDFPNGRVEANENFRVVCAGNTYGTGADMVYVGRNVLDGATLDRFVVLHFDYDEEVEKQLAYDNELFNFIRDLRKAINKIGLRYIVSMRALINSTKMLEIGVDKKTILETTIIKNMQKDDLNLVINELDNSNSWYSEVKRMCD